MKSLSILCVLVLNWLSCNGERILFLSPVSTKSHKIGFMPIAEALAERGHQVTVVSPVKPLKQIKNLREIVIEKDYYSSENFDWFEMGSHDPDLTSLSGIIYQFRALNIEGYQLFRANQDVQQIIRSKEVDLVVIDATINDFCFPLIEHLKVPFISYIPSTGIPWTINAMGVPSESAYVPGGANDHGSDMTFVERALNSLGMELFLWCRRYFVLGMVDEMVREDFPNSRPIAEIERDAELLVMNSHPTTSWSRPLPPYAIPIGPLHVRSAQPLPKDLQTFADGAHAGFIVLTFGSAIPVSSMPTHIVEMFVRVFARIPQRVFWKWEKGVKIEGKLTDNVMMVDWLPQQDLLGHENARLFVSHGGLMGVQEAVFHGVPLLGLPFGNDQRGNIARLREQGFAMKLGWNELNESILYETIQTLLHQQSYRESAIRMSQLMQDEMMSGREVAVYWIEHVLRHGGTKHLQNRAKYLPFYQRHLLDVWLFLSVVLAISIYINYKMFCWILHKSKTSHPKVKAQ